MNVTRLKNHLYWANNGGMMNKVLAIAVLFGSVQGFAQFSNSTSSTGGRAEQTTTPNVAPTPSAINDSANYLQDKNSEGSGVAQLVGVGMMGMGAMKASQKRWPEAAMYFLMGAMSFQQASNHGGAGYSAGVTGDLTNGGAAGSYSNGTTGGTQFDDSKWGDKLITDLNDKGIKGFSYDSKNKAITTPDGKTLKMSDVGNEGAMSAAGFSKADYESALNQVKNLEKIAEKKYKVGEFGTEDASGGGGGNKSGAGDASGADATGAGANRGIASLDSRGAATGLTKDYHGEPIGVANDSLFDMMTRRYQLKNRQDSFFNGTELVLQK